MNFNVEKISQGGTVTLICPHCNKPTERSGNVSKLKWYENKCKKCGQSLEDVKPICNM